MTNRKKEEDISSEPETITIMSAEQIPAQALEDLFRGFQKHHVWMTFASHDIKQRFRRSVIGPLWLTLTMGIMVGTLGLVFSTIFRQEPAEILPYIATGIIFWGFLTSSITDGTTTFSSAENFIKNVPVHLSMHFYRMLARNIIILMFNMAIYFVVILLYPHDLNANYLLSIPGIFLFLFNAAWLSLVAGILSARYRDIPQIIINAMQVVFFLTPIFWSTETLPGRPAFVEWNPFYHLLEVVRAPLLGKAPSLLSWQVSLGLAILGPIVAILLYRRTYSRIPYWV